MVLEQTRQRGGIVVQSFATQADAEAAVRALRDAGFTNDEISVVARDEGRAREVVADTGGETAKGAGIGAATGGVLGALAGLLVGAAVIAIPGVGIVLAGPLAAALGGAVAGGFTGGLAGALAGLGVARDEAHHYQQRLEAGDIVVVVAAGPREATARQILHDRPGATVETTGYSAATAERPTTNTGTTGTAVGRWEDEAPGYRASWEQRYGASSGRWEDIEPSYRYGWECANDPRYQGRRWSDVEPEVRRDWESRHPNTPWERAGEAIRDTWERRPGR